MTECCRRTGNVATRPRCLYPKIGTVSSPLHVGMKAKTLTYVRPREVAEGRVSLPAKALKAQALEYVLSSNTNSLYISGLAVRLVQNRNQVHLTGAALPGQTTPARIDPLSGLGLSLAGLLHPGMPLPCALVFTLGHTQSIVSDSPVGVVVGVGVGIHVSTRQHNDQHPPRHIRSLLARHRAHEPHAPRVCYHTSSSSSPSSMYSCWMSPVTSPSCQVSSP